MVCAELIDFAFIVFDLGPAGVTRGESGGGGDEARLGGTETLLDWRERSGRAEGAEEGVGAGHGKGEVGW